MTGEKNTVDVDLGPQNGVSDASFKYDTKSPPRSAGTTMKSRGKAERDSAVIEVNFQDSNDSTSPMHKSNSSAKTHHKPKRGG